MPPYTLKASVTNRSFPRLLRSLLTISMTLMVSMERTQKPTVTSTGPPVNQSTINQSVIELFNLA